MRKIVLTAIIAFGLPGLLQAATYKEMFGRDPAVSEADTKILLSLDFKTTPLDLPSANAKLLAPKNFYYLNGPDAAKVLVNLWGNPPQSAEGILGMIFPAGKSPEDGSGWGSTVFYAAEGYVSDSDAESADYDSLLTQLKEETTASNPARITAGYEPITLVGWASAPHYDKQQHALHWARDLLFGNDKTAAHTLNYQLRALGREGVIELNFIAGMNQLDEIKAAIPEVIGLVDYDKDKKYEEFKDGDRVAAYGLAGLIAAAAGTKLAAKVGFLALAAIFFKKGAVVVLVAVAAAGRWISRLFGRKPKLPPSDGAA